MYKCSKCKIEKPLYEFSKSKNSRGFLYHCKDCQRQYIRNHYQNNKASYIKKARKRDAIQIEIGRKLIYDYLFAHPCVDCGESDIMVLQFDHVRGEKKHSVSAMIKNSLGNYAAMKEEIEKCEVRCANCHVRQTFKRGGFWRYKLLEQSENEGSNP